MASPSIVPIYSTQLRQRASAINNVLGPFDQFAQILWLRDGGFEVRRRDEMTERQVRQVLAQLGETPLP